MNKKNLIYLLSALSYFEVHDHEFWDRLSKDIILGRIKITHSEDLQTLLIFFAKSRYRNTKLLSIIEESLLYANESRPINQHINELWAFSILEYYEESTEYVKIFDKRLLSLPEDSPLSLELIAKTLYSYSLIKDKLNVDVLKKILKMIVNLEEILPKETDTELEITPQLYHSLTVIVKALAKMNIRNEKVYSMVATRIMCDIKHHDSLPIKSIESAQIFSSYTKVEFFNPKFLRTMEDLFLTNIQDSSPETTANMLLSHWEWGKYIARSTFTDNGSREFFKEFKVYHIQFVSLLLNDLLSKDLNNLSYKAFYYIIKMANLKHLKNRSNARSIFQIGIHGIDKLFEYLNNNKDINRESEILQYYYELSQTMNNKAWEKQAKEKFIEHGINIDDLLNSVERVLNEQNNTI